LYEEDVKIILCPPALLFALHFRPIRCTRARLYARALAEQKARQGAEAAQPAGDPPGPHLP
jgi:hypothetical protein